MVTIHPWVIQLVTIHPFYQLPAALNCTARRQENKINLRAILMNQREKPGCLWLCGFRTIMGLSHAADLLEPLMQTTTDTSTLCEAGRAMNHLMGWLERFRQ